MPANVIKAWNRDTPATKTGLEKDWKRAKKAAGKQGKSNNYKYRMAIFKKMTQKEVDRCFRRACQQFDYETTGEIRLPWTISLEPFFAFAKAISDAVLAIKELSEIFQ